MKTITAYVDGKKLRFLRQQLERLGVETIEFIEYYSVSPKISWLKLTCNDETAERERLIVADAAHTDTACDQCLRISDAHFDDPNDALRYGAHGPWQ